MKRRKFLYSTTATSMLPLFGKLDVFRFDIMDQSILETFVKGNDTRVESVIQRQEIRKGHPNYGGWPDKYEIYHPGHACSYAEAMVSAYVSPKSKYFRSQQVEERLNLGIEFLLRCQHEDGNIDLLTTNFHSPPDAAFASESLGLALAIARKHAPTELKTFQQLAKEFLEAAGRAMIVGGIHTPNHRWVVCAALSRIHHIFPHPDYPKRIQQWLDEGIDIDPDGQYTEKSSVVYSPITDDALITVARLMDRKELYEPVRKNLRMTQYMVHTNGEVVTEASRRQDKFTVANLARYYYSYRYMAILDQDPTFAAMAKQIEESVGLDKLWPNLYTFLEDEHLLKDLPQAVKLARRYTKHFPFSLMARIRREEVDVSVLGENSTFCTYFKGNACLQAVRLASAFFGKGQFVSPTLKVEEGRYILEQELHGPYYQPHKKEDIAEDGDWEKMPRKLRVQTEVQYQKSRVEIYEEDEKFMIQISVKGTDRVPVAIELAFRPGGSFTGIEAAPASETSFLMTEEMGTYTFGKDTISFGPGRREHAYTQIRGAKDKLNGDSVYITGYTPFEYTLELS